MCPVAHSTTFPSWLTTRPPESGCRATSLAFHARNSSALSEEVGDNQDEVDAEEFEGEGGKIAFNSRYLLDVLSVLERGKLTLETTTSSSPGVFKPTDSDDYIHVVIPIFVQW